MAITEAFDGFELVIGEDRTVDEDRDRHEPVLANTPLFFGFDEPTRLDPGRIGLVWELSPAATRAMPLRSPLVSLAVHLLPLLTVLVWPSPAVDIPAPMPVQLVYERPKPPPPVQRPQPPPQPPAMQTGRLASVEMGDVTPKDLGETPSPSPPNAGEEADPLDTPVATAVPPLPPPKPAPPKPPPQPAPQAQPAAPTPPAAQAQPTPRPVPRPQPVAQPVAQPARPSGAPVPRHDDTPHPAPHAAQYAGPTANRDDYLAYLVKLTRQHIDLLPMSVIGDRHGETVVSVVVYSDGTIGPLGVVRSSGYPDLDHRIEQMIAAVRKFPPLPQWYQGNAVQLELTLRFPDALEKS